MKPATSFKPGPAHAPDAIGAQATLATISIQSSGRPQSLAACRGATSIVSLGGLCGCSAIALSEVNSLLALPGVRSACG